MFNVLSEIAWECKFNWSLQRGIEYVYLEIAFRSRTLWDDKSFGFAMGFLLIQWVNMPILHPKVISRIIFVVILFMAR